jgi:NAD(P)H-hydrate repair Nnr-like enzyme with NAD(P)H-hydrate epimerase domain
MKPSELINKVARIADTSPKHSHITVTDVSRVHGKIWEQLAALPSDELMLYVAKAVAKAKQDKARERAKKKKS